MFIIYYLLLYFLFCHIIFYDKTISLIRLLQQTHFLNICFYKFLDYLTGILANIFSVISNQTARLVLILILNILFLSLMCLNTIFFIKTMGYFYLCFLFILACLHVMSAIIIYVIEIHLYLDINDLMSYCKILRESSENEKNKMIFQSTLPTNSEVNYGGKQYTIGTLIDLIERKHSLYKQFVAISKVFLIFVAFFFILIIAVLFFSL